jgi:muramoyltetrapeptide carboxypeptidase
MKLKIPPQLKQGSTIGITCPAGYMAADKAQTCIATLQKWGFNVMVGKTLGSKSKTYFSGTDAERTAELQAMMDSNEIDAILCGRGGYGVGKIIDQLDFTHFKKNPKWIIGFSDITVLHSHIVKNYNIATLHAPMAAAFNDNGFKNKYILSLKNALFGIPNIYEVKSSKLNKAGKAQAPIVGGNLSLIAHLIGTKDQLNTTGKILFLEDIGEQLYNIDRMMTQLKRSGALNNLAALILGGFTDCKDTERPFGKKINDILASYLSDVNYPVCFNFPISHNKENYAIKCGCTYQLDVSNKKVTLKEVI